VVPGAEETLTVGVEAPERGGRPDGNNETRLEEMRESVACAGCADADMEVGASGGEDVGSDVVELVGEDIDGGEALSLRRGGSG
jgi:hypothetical protein